MGNLGEEIGERGRVGGGRSRERGRREIQQILDTWKRRTRGRKGKEKRRISNRLGEPGRGLENKGVSQEGDPAGLSRAGEGDPG